MNRLDIALNRMAELRAELADLEIYLRVHYRLFPEDKLSALKAAGTLKFYGGDGSTPVDNCVDKSVDKAVDKRVEVSVLDSAPPVVRRRIIRRKKATDPLVDAMEEILRTTVRPATRGELVALIHSRGLVIPSEDKARYVGTVLWRNQDRFRNLPGFGYWLRSQPYPPAGYDPSADTEQRRLLDIESGLAEKSEEEQIEEDQPTDPEYDVAEDNETDLELETGQVETSSMPTTGRIRRRL